MERTNRTQVDGALCILLVVATIGILALGAAADPTPNVLNTTTLGGNLTSYEVTNIEFDHTINTLFITAKDTDVNVHFSSNELFDIWDFSVEMDGQPIYYVARPGINQEGKAFVFDYEYLVSGTHFFKINYFMNNVKPTRPEWLYPFDSYSLLLRNAEITEGITKTIKLNFPQVDISQNININYQINTQIPPDTNISINSPLVVTGSKYQKILGPVCVIDNQICGMNISAFRRFGKGDVEFRMNVPFTFKPLEETTRISFARGNFSKYLFGVVALYLLGITTYHLRKRKRFQETLYEIYVGTSTLTWLLSEFTVGLVPPYRPITITLFDLIVFMPLLIVAIVFVCKAGNKWIRNKKNKPAGHLLQLLQKTKLCKLQF